MSGLRLIRRPSIVFAVALALSVASPAGASRPERLVPNVRPFFDVGYSIPILYGDLDHGFGFGFGFEAEQSPRVSVLLRFEWNRLEGPRVYEPYYGYDRSYAMRVHAADYSVGARVHLRMRGPVRPYTEASLGVRFSGPERGGYYADALSGAGDSRVPDEEGVAAMLRLGLSTAPPGGAGLFLDAGLDFLVRNPDHYGIVPIRLGIQFP